MPLYSYECESCGNQFTVLVRQQSQVDTPVCPECGSKQTQRMVPRVAVQFKGSGYYKTDYARNGKANSAAAKSSSGAKAAKDTGSARNEQTGSQSDNPQGNSSSSQSTGSTEAASASKKTSSHQ